MATAIPCQRDAPHVAGGVASSVFRRHVIYLLKIHQIWRPRADDWGVLGIEIGILVKVSLRPLKIQRQLLPVADRVGRGIGAGEERRRRLVQEPDPGVTYL